MDLIKQVTQSQQKSNIPPFGPGDQVRVWYRIVEQDRVRQAPFEGLVIRRRGSGISETFTVRRMTHGEGVERVFPLHAPVLERIEVLRPGKVRRSRLYFLRTKIGKTRLPAATGAAQAGIASAEGTTAAEEPAEAGQSAESSAKIPTPPDKPVEGRTA